MKNQFVGFHWDFLGFSASLLCAIHCALMPLLLSLIPLAGLRFLNNNWFEYIIILFSFLIASYALVHGYYWHHRKPLALTIFAIGFIFIGTGHIFPEGKEVLMTSAGGIIIAIAHLINWKYLKQFAKRVSR